MAQQEITPREKQELREKELTRAGRYYVPEVDIYEDPDGLWLWADMPGVDQEHAEVEIHDNVLSIKGEVALKEYEGLAPLYTEYNVGPYLRRFTLGDSSLYDTDRISARMVNGVLEVQVPRAEKAKPRRIAVSAG